MPQYFVRQPNGLLARFSTVVDNFCEVDMTEAEALEWCRERMGEASARDKVRRAVYCPHDETRRRYKDQGRRRSRFMDSERHGDNATACRVCVGRGQNRAREMQGGSFMSTDLKALLLDPAYRAKLLEADAEAETIDIPEARRYLRAMLELIGELQANQKPRPLTKASRP